ncbi:valine--tRNA ligase [Seohaeicola sp. SP36]|uniref:valine--tRNA ligase n=1 Tax=unclassified Seohaeicola TaxID=2641111 RepID=UPI00237AD2F1|nr:MULTISPECIES: valine--tRNA ligase [unclassified Seohaeicola]MDD9708218.1 valine--tRNA ligase [Seohaeicola sp. 4SK31]MDD9736384.1 valine--tRNA ligase [Seohaeicola sp. SP36]
MAMDKTFDAATAEARLSAAWEAAGCFRAGANAKPGADTFCIMLPPPNVTGSLHVGHAFNHTLMDVLIRWKRMQGVDTLWQPGLDHAGIATQLQVEKLLAQTKQPGRRELGREKFLEKVWEWKAQYGGTIVMQDKRLGTSMDWDRLAFTMTGAPGDPSGGTDGPNFHDAVIKVFVDMYKKGLIYRGKRLVNWDPHFETAISDLEVENLETDGHMWHFKYPLAGGETYTYVERDEDGNVLFTEDRDYISIATTRPETMLGDGAVAVHPEDERYAPIVGKLCEIPVGPKEHRRLIPIITDEYPDRNFGSGAVKITGAHDFNDYQVAKRGGIPMYRLMDTRGQMRADGAPYSDAAARAQAIANGAAFTEAEVDTLNLVPDHLRGLDRFEARKRVVAEITAEGLAVMTEATDPRLGKAALKAPLEPSEGGEMRTEAAQLVPLVESKKIMQPFGDRSGVVIEPMLTDQWFVDAAKVVGPALDAVRTGRTKIIPESGEKVYYHWLENIEPWCISRQLWWGHQIPVWFDDEGREYCAASEAEAQAMAPGKTLTRDPDVLDTWFSSGLWPIGTLGWPEQTQEMARYFPTDVLITGQDILFFWVARMMMMQLAVVDEVPFHTVYLHQLVRDEKGQKMSKTRGNVIDPLQIVDEFGADALRFTMVQMAALGGVLKLSTERIKGYRNFGTKIWNACRFAEMNGVWEGHATQATPPAATATVNRWIIGETARVRAEVDAALDAYRFNDAANALYAFVWGKVCDWYVEFSKPLLMDGDAETRAETQKVMAWVLDQCLIMLHPIMPFITEELWSQTGTRAKMLVHADWPAYSATDLADPAADREMTWVIGLIDAVRSARAQMRVPAGLQVPMVLRELDAPGREAWARNEALIRKLARIDSLTEVPSFPKGTVTIPVEGGIFGLPLADIIDVAEEKSRLEKTLEKLAKEIGGLKGRLNNPNFATSAPEEVVAETRDNLALRLEEEATLKTALSQLAELD